MTRIVKTTVFAALLACALGWAALAQSESGISGADLILADQLSTTEGIAVCPDGSMFTAENGSGKVFQVVDDETVKLYAEGLKRPAGLACGEGNVLYAAGYGDGAVLKIKPGEKEHTVVATGFKNPNGIIVGPDGAVYMSDSTSGIVYRIGADGKQEKLLDGITFANGLYIDGGNLYIAQTTPNKITMTPLSGENKGKKKTFAKNLTMVDGITGDGAGNIYACLYAKGEVAVVDKEGKATVIASGLGSPATPAIKGGFLYVTTLNGKGLFRIKLAAGK